MAGFRVLIVEDDPFIALALEAELLGAGCDVCGVEASQEGALRSAEIMRPPYAVVDVQLSPGDGRVVAKALFERYGTAVLLATAHCGDIADLARTGAAGCLPKPYWPQDVLPALAAARDMLDGRRPSTLPDHMLALTS
jgi:CheY-like chemotaxis protein